MQEWALFNVCLGQLQNGEPVIDDDNVAAVMMDDFKHRYRSAAAETVTANAAAAHPLPEGARDGGALSADPHCKAERIATEGVDYSSCF